MQQSPEHNNAGQLDQAPEQHESISTPEIEEIPLLDSPELVAFLQELEEILTPRRNDFMIRHEVLSAAATAAHTKDVSVLNGPRTAFNSGSLLIGNLANVNMADSHAVGSALAQATNFEGLNPHKNISLLLDHEALISNARGLCHILVAYFGKQSMPIVRRLSDIIARLQGVQAQAVEIEEDDLYLFYQQGNNDVSSTAHWLLTREKAMRDCLATVLGRDLLVKAAHETKGREEEDPESSFQMRETLESLMWLIDQSSEVREKILRIADTFSLLADAEFAAQIVRLGWNTLRDIDDLSELQWWTGLERFWKRNDGFYALSERDPKKAVNLPTDNWDDLEINSTSLRIGLRHKIRLLPSEASNSLSKLRDVIRCDEYKEELHRINSMGASREIVASLEREIIQRVIRFVLPFERKFRDKNVNYTQTECYLEGYPRFTHGEQQLNCYTANWLIATMLVECGLLVPNIFYASVNKSGTKMSGGGHGMLIVKCNDLTTVAIDIACHIFGKPFTFNSGSSAEDYQHTLSALNGKSTPRGGARLRLRPDSDSVDIHHMPIDANIMSLEQGITATHYYNIGVDFYQQGKFDEARYALRLSRLFNPHSPDVYYYLGAMAYQERDFEQAERFFRTSIKYFPEHLWSLFSLGELYYKFWDRTEDAEVYFERVTQSDIIFWGDHRVLDLSARYLDEIRKS